MPLTPPAPRELMHNRAISLAGYRRADGLWDIEAQLVDTRTFPMVSAWRNVPPGAAIHDMGMRLTVGDDLVVRAVEAAMAANPYDVCPVVTANFQRLVGLKIGPGFVKEARGRVGGIEGCTHLVELLGPLATVAMQTIFSAKRAWRDGPSDQNPAVKPRLIDSCHAFRSDGEIAGKRWPAYLEARRAKG